LGFGFLGLVNFALSKDEVTWGAIRYMSIFEDKRDELSVQLTLLWRNYESMVRHYDKPSLVELAHTLRWWADASYMLKDVDLDFSRRVFCSVTPGKKIKRLMNRRAHFAAYFYPGGISIYTGNNNLITSLDQNFNEDGFPCFIFQPATVTQPGESALNHLIYIDRPKNDGELKALGDEAHSYQLRRLDFCTWLNAEAIRFASKEQAKEGKSSRLTHESIIREVANNYGSSHPTIRRDSIKIKHDPDVAYLMSNWLIYDVPLPYFMLLKIAKAILKNFSPVLAKQKNR